jgi:hypothetical protein
VEVQNGAVEGPWTLTNGGVWRLTIEPRPGPDPHQNEKSEPDTPEREKMDPDTHQIDEDSQKRCKCSKKTENVCI